MTQLFGELWFWRQPWSATQSWNVLGLGLWGGDSDPALIHAPSNDKSIPEPSLGPSITHNLHVRSTASPLLSGGLGVNELPRCPCKL